MAQANAVTALLLALIAGLCTLLGALIIFFSKGKNERLVTASLGFAAGVMLAVSFADLFPQGQDLLLAWGGHTKGALTAVAAFCGGLALAAGLDLLVPHDVPDPATGQASRQPIPGGFYLHPGHRPAQLSRGHRHLYGRL